MIDVPYEVKKALKDGRTQKKYRFVLGEEEWHEVGRINTLGWYSPSTNYGDDEKFTIRDSKTYRFIVEDADHDTYALYCYKSNDPNWRLVEPVSRNTWDVTVNADSAYVEINNSFSSGHLFYPVSVQNYYAETIDNNNLVSESVNIDERMCSGDTLKFGLCEGSSLEFQYFGKENITGRHIQAFVDVEYGAAQPYTIPMGFFDVKKCSRQASTGIIKVTAYNKLQSEYLDAKANDILINAAAHSDRYSALTLDKLLEKTLGAYAIEKTFSPAQCTSQIVVAAVVTSDFQSRWKVFPVNPNSEFYYVSSVQEKFTLTATSADMLYRMRLNASKLTDLYYLYLEPTEGVIVANGSQAVSLNDQAYVRIHENYLNYTDYPYGDEGEYSTPNLQNAVEISLEIRFIDYGNNEWYPYDPPTNDELIERYMAIKNSIDFHLEQFLLSGVNTEIFTLADVQSWPDVTLRELQTAAFETSCQFGQLDRVTDLFSGVELRRDALYPADGLYPANNLYPRGAALSTTKALYSKLWADEGNVHKWRYLIITYKGLDEEEKETDYTLQRTINSDGTDDYNMSDNWLFRNLVWTASQVGEYADAMVAKMQDITWFPFEMWCAGLPYLETGDEIEITLGEETYTSYILQRQLKGIQNLQDTYINGTLDIF